MSARIMGPGWMEGLMRAVLCTPGLLLFAACDGTTLEGDWEGVCALTLDESGEETDLEIDYEIEVERERGGQAEGQGLYQYSGSEFNGQVTGNRDGTRLELTLEGEYGGYTVKLELDGELDDDEASGNCRFGGARGLFEMDR